jgi:4-hydroxybenzoate polyprenyltransferase
MEAVFSGFNRQVCRERIQAYARFLKLEHTLFSLPILLGGVILPGRGWPSWRLMGLIVLAAAAARTLALCLNRIIDKNIDRKNPRTAGRELAAGRLSLGDALLLTAGSLALYVWAAREINVFCLTWSWLPVLLFAIYPTLKRFTWLCHVGLGVTWAMAPLAGWFAVSPGFDGAGPAYVLALFSALWLAGFDVIYATLDEEFDRKEGLFSIPARFGRRNALRISSLLHGAAFLCLALLYFTSLSGVAAAFLMLAAGFLLFLEHMSAEKVELAFFKINVLTGFVVLAMIWFGVGKEF